MIAIVMSIIPSVVQNENFTDYSQLGDIPVKGLWYTNWDPQTYNLLAHINAIMPKIIIACADLKQLCMFFFFPTQQRCYPKSLLLNAMPGS